MTDTAKPWYRSIRFIDIVVAILFGIGWGIVRHHAGGIAVAIDRSIPIGIAVYIVLRNMIAQEKANAPRGGSLGLTQESVPADRRPFSKRYHPNWVFALPAMGICLGFCDVYGFDDPIRNYLYAAPWVLAWQLVQLVRDYRASEWWYRLMTTTPFRWTTKQYLSKKWPSFLSLLAVPVFGAFPVMALFFLFTGFFYFWQRSLYLRSIREFGPADAQIRNAGASIPPPAGTPVMPPTGTAGH